MITKNKVLKKKCIEVKVVITDVDGVLTDGGMFYSKNGEMLKKFNTRDGMGVELLRNNKIPVIIITRENSKIVLSRAKKLLIDDVNIGIKKKEMLLPKICKKYQINKENVAYIGDDINDLEILKQVGFSASPCDGISIIKKESDYICQSKGGEGVLREVADLIISYQN
ncbi:MAG: 3-deoxy-D-manno-octulosonate 8-phosphate phosphatase [Thaumarchaeota archaeon]|jgi:YrbI family 3-deoxy-D-manno-octulosonate 8-phosphate phosphatase|nr:MAG: 3-deoxy-D-manno-octulosonate 8-phosphate phosphatase [Nitrososphaerota archaeon]